LEFSLARYTIFCVFIFFFNYFMHQRRTVERRVAAVAKDFLVPKKNIKNKNMPRRPAVKGRRNKFASFRHEL
jgi:hypothetical protein